MDTSVLELLISCLKGKNLLEYTNIFSSNEYKKNGKIILNALSIAYRTCGHEYETIFNEEESTDILKIFGAIINIEEYQKIYIHVRRKHQSRI